MMRQDGFPVYGQLGVNGVEMTVRSMADVSMT